MVKSPAHLRLVNPSEDDHADTPLPAVERGRVAKPARRPADRKAPRPRPRDRSVSHPPPVEGPSDAELVSRLCETDEDVARRAAEQLYRRHAAFALNLATRIAGNASEAEDVVHDSFLKAFRGASSLKKRSAFRGWLGSIVVYTMRSRLRRVRLMRLLGLSRGEAVDIDQLVSPAASPATRAELAQLYALLRTLRADERIAWTLRKVEGHDLRTISELTHCSLATTKRRIRRAQHHIDAHFVPTANEATDGTAATSGDSSNVEEPCA